MGRLWARVSCPSANTTKPCQHANRLRLRPWRLYKVGSRQAHLGGEQCLDWSCRGILNGLCCTRTPQHVNRQDLARDSHVSWSANTPCRHRVTTFVGHVFVKSNDPRDRGQPACVEPWGLQGRFSCRETVLGSLGCDSEWHLPRKEQSFEFPYRLRRSFGLHKCIENFPRRW